MSQTAAPWRGPTYYCAIVASLLPILAGLRFFTDPAGVAGDAGIPFSKETACALALVGVRNEAMGLICLLLVFALRDRQAFGWALSTSAFVGVGDALSIAFLGEWQLSFGLALVLVSTLCSILAYYCIAGDSKPARLQK